jgi:uncharacterized membrane protein
MDESFLALSSLPNLHPALVHLPLALLPAAALCDLLALLLPTRVWLERAAALLYVFAALGASAAFLAGEHAADTIGPQPAEVHAILEEHEDLARDALIALIALAIARPFLSWRDRDRPRLTGTVWRCVLLLTACGTLVLLAATADHGGNLVYRHGVAVRRTAAP